MPSTQCCIPHSGDHSITYPIIKGLASRHARLSIVHIDAHPDMYPTFEGNAYSHACPFARILEVIADREQIMMGRVEMFMLRKSWHFAVAH